MWSMFTKSINRFAVVAAVALALLLASATVARPDVTRVKTPSTLKSEGGSVISLPPGYFVPDPDWFILDLELKRLQEKETRLEAENKSLRRKPGLWAWVKASAALSLGILIGRYALNR